jgi:hypothetical protein
LAVSVIIIMSHRAFIHILLKSICFRLFSIDHYYIKIESINFALLGGRIVFSELVYSTQNTTIRIVDGTITFRWWVYATRQSLHDSATKLCRLHVHLSGVEYFLFNNVARYKRLRQWIDRQPVDADGNIAVPPDLFDAAAIAVPGYFKLFPVIDISLSRASLMIGNPELPGVVLIQSPRAGGVYAADKALSAHDGYKWVIAVQLASAVVTILGNSEFLRDEELVAIDEEARRASMRSRTLFTRFRDFLSRLSSPTFMSTRSVGAVPRLVERKPRVDAAFEDDHANLCEAEVLTCRDLTVVYRVDVNGWWPSDWVEATPSTRGEAHSTRSAGGADDASASTDQQPQHQPNQPNHTPVNVNDEPPEWSITIDAKGAQFTYGPWADRQRALTSRFFFPWDYKPLEHVKRGAGLRREHEALAVTLNLHNEFGIRVPFRTAAAMAGKCGARGTALRVDDAEAMASLLINGSDAFVQYVAPMFLNARHGHRATCRTDATLRTTQPLTVTTSVRNADAPLMRANGLLFRLAMHQQAVWNADNVYAFRIRVREPRIFVTDSDVRVLKQMAADWVLTTQLKATLGRADFIPTLYTLDIGLTDFRLHINTNEMNVVGNENDLDDNAHLLLLGQQLKLDIDYPALLFGAVATTVAVRARSARAQVRHMYAEHHTVRLFAPGGSLAPASVHAHEDPNSELRRDGLRFITVQEIDTHVTYKYHYEVRPGWRDSMQLRVKAARAEGTLYGHFLRHMLFWLDNFLGLARKRRSPARWRDIWSGAQPATPRKSTCPRTSSRWRSASTSTASCAAAADATLQRRQRGARRNHQVSPRRAVRAALHRSRDHRRADLSARAAAIGGEWWRAARLDGDANECCGARRRRLDVSRARPALALRSAHRGPRRARALSVWSGAARAHVPAHHFGQHRQRQRPRAAAAAARARRRLRAARHALQGPRQHGDLGLLSARGAVPHDGARQDRARAAARVGRRVSRRAAGAGRRAHCRRRLATPHARRVDRRAPRRWRSVPRASCPRPRRRLRSPPTGATGARSVACACRASRSRPRSARQSTPPPHSGRSTISPSRIVSRSASGGCGRTSRLPACCIPRAASTLTAATRGTAIATVERRASMSRHSSSSRRDEPAAVVRGRHVSRRHLAAAVGDRSMPADSRAASATPPLRHAVVGAGAESRAPRSVQSRHGRLSVDRARRPAS